MSILSNNLNVTADVANLRAGTPTPSYNRTDDKLKDVAQAFEGLFLQQFLKAGRAATFGDELIDSSAVKTSQDLLDTELTQASSKTSGLGIAEAIYRQFSAQVTGR